MPPPHSAAHRFPADPSWPWGSCTPALIRASQRRGLWNLFVGSHRTWVGNLYNSRKVLERMDSSRRDVTRLLTELRDGDKEAESKLMALVYDELHHIAERYMRRERSDHTLQPTALVNEAYMRMLTQRDS